MLSDGYRVKATMLGKGELEERCKNYILENDLTGVVQMKGFVENPYDYLNEGTILVMASEWEGFGLVAVEALAFGVPVVANPVGGIPMIVNGKCGCLTDNHCEKVNEIEKLISNDEYYIYKSMNAKNELRNFKILTHI